VKERNTQGDGVAIIFKQGKAKVEVSEIRSAAQKAENSKAGT
jgi:ATP-dependent Clp protease adapter protein ClpS